MHLDHALLSAISALLGALIGGGASLSAAIYTQRFQGRLHRVARETTKREGSMQTSSRALPNWS